MLTIHIPGREELNLSHLILDYNGTIAVRGLSMDAEVKILSSTGQLVWSGVSAGGTFTWDGRTQKGRRVASGVYHIVANNAEGKKAIVARIVIIR